MPTHRGRPGREEADERDQEQARVEPVGAVVLDERAELGVEAVLEHVRRGSASRVAAHRSSGPSRPSFSIAFTARSNATQHMTFECVKWRRGPRTSQMPSSGSRQPVSSHSKSLRAIAHASSDALEAARRREVQRVDDLAVDVELELVRRVVSDANGLRSLVALEPGELELDQPPLARDAVEDLEVLRRSGDRAEQPLPPLARLVEVAGCQEGEQGQSRVAQPAVAVVPVANAPDRFRQRRRGRRDDAARRRVRQRLQRDERAPDRIATSAPPRALAHPVAPVVERLAEGLLGVDRPPAARGWTETT